MPLLYGEEEKAFRRLQEEIIKSTPDLSIFAWSLSGRHNDGLGTYCSVLAEAPGYFAGVVPSELRTDALKVEFSISNIGVRLQSTLATYQEGQQGFHYVLPLNHATIFGGVLVVLLRKVGKNQFLRIDPYRIYNIDISHVVPVLHGTHHLLLKPPPHQAPDPDPRMSAIWVNEEYIQSLRLSRLSIKLSTPNLRIHQIYPRSRFDEKDQLFFLNESDDDRQDWGVLKLSLQPEIAINKGHPPVTVEFMLYVTSWGCLPEPQYSLVPCGDYAREIDAVHSEVVAPELDSRSLLHALAEQDIPRTTQAVIEVPDTRYTAIVAVNCSGGYCKWNLDITGDVIETGSVPNVQQITTWWKLHGLYAR